MLQNILETKGDQALAGFGGAKGSNEEAYLFQKLISSVTLTNNKNVRTFAVRSWAWDNYLNEGSLAEPPQNPNYLEVRSSQEAERFQSFQTVSVFQSVSTVGIAHCRVGTANCTVETAHSKLLFYLGWKP